MIPWRLAWLTPSLSTATLAECGNAESPRTVQDRNLLAWVRDRLTTPDADITSTPLHGSQGPWLLTVTQPSRPPIATVLRVPTPRIWASQIATNAAALAVAGRYGFPAPRLLAVDLSGHQAGTPATLETVMIGTTRWPPGPRPALLRAAGAALAALHRIRIEPTAELPRRPRPIAFDDFAADRRAGRLLTSQLLDRADDLVHSTTPSARAPVFVHGDVWPGNLTVSGDVVDGLIDWKTAGVGDRGVDLGELRKQVAMSYGPDAAAVVLAGYSRASGLDLDDVAYWDAVAALNTPTRIPEPFRRRRDDFLRSACDHL